MISPELYKNVFRRHAASVAVIATRSGAHVQGMTATAFTAVSLKPPLVLFCVHRASSTHQALDVGNLVGVSLLSCGQQDLSDRFSSKGPDRYFLDDLRLDRSPHGAPVIPDACAVLEVALAYRYWGGDHSIFMGTVTWADDRPHLAPLIYHSGSYASVVSTDHLQKPPFELAAAE